MRSVGIVVIAMVVSTVSGGTSSLAAQLHTAPAAAPARTALADSVEAGTRMIVSGRVVDDDGKPIARASIYAYQTDANGEYVRGSTGGSDRPRIYGYLRSDAEGRYAFSTIRPGSYPNSRNPGHIHFEVTAPGHEDRSYEIVFEGDPFISTQFRTEARKPFGAVAVVTVRSGRAAQEVTHDIRLQKRN